MFRELVLKILLSQAAVSVARWLKMPEKLRIERKTLPEEVFLSIEIRN